MEAATFLAHTPSRRPLSALSKLTIGALSGLALALVYVQVVLLGAFMPDLAIFAGIIFFAAVLIGGVPLGGWRWTPLLGSLLSALVLIGNRGPIIYDLTHPESFHLFAYMVVAVALALVGVVAGVSATVQNYRSVEPRAPRGTAVAVAALVGLCAGALLIGAIPRSAGAGVSPELLAQLPAITTPGMYFDQPELKAEVGETVALRLVNSHGAPHSFDIDELNVHVGVASGQTGLVMFQPTAPGSYTFYCAVPGHREAGMVGTLVVE